MMKGITETRHAH